MSKSIQAKLTKQRQEWEAAGLAPEAIENLYAGYLVAQKAAHNRYWAKRRIYEQAEWGSNFNKEKFCELQDAFNVKTRELGASDDAGEEETEHSKELLELYRIAAGPRAV